MPGTLKTCPCAQCRKRAAAGSEITNKINAELAKHAQYEGKVVAAVFSTASLLLQLHGLGRDIWKEQLKVLGLNSRLALHYLNLARTDLAKCDPSSTRAHYRGRRSAKTQEKSRSARFLDTPAGSRTSKKNRSAALAVAEKLSSAPTFRR